MSSARARAFERLNSAGLSSAPRPKTLDSCIHGVHVLRSTGKSLPKPLGPHHTRPMTAAAILVHANTDACAAEGNAYDETDTRENTGDWTVLLKHCGIHTKITMDNRGITRVPGLIGAFKRLRTLSLRSNKLSTLPEAFAELQQLNTLNLGDNVFEALPMVLRQLGASLQKLHMFNNCLSGTLDRNVLGALCELRTLNVNQNFLTHFPDELCLLHKLETLSAQQNALTALPEALGNLKYLQTLDLTDNNIRHVPDSVHRLARLAKCSLLANKLRVFPKCLSLHPSLRELDLSVNLIESFDTDGLAFARQKMRRLHFEENPFLSPLKPAHAARIFHGIPTLQELCLRNLFVEIPSRGSAPWERDPILQQPSREELQQLLKIVRKEGQNCPVCAAPLVRIYLAVVKYEMVGRFKVPVDARLCSYRCLLKRRQVYFATERTLREGQYAETFTIDDCSQVPQPDVDTMALGGDIIKLHVADDEMLKDGLVLPDHWAHS